MPYFVSRSYRLFYREAGAGPPLLILHGNTSSSAMHQGELDHFGGRFHAVAPDFLGCGQSDRDDKWSDAWWQDAADDAAALVRRLAQGPAVAVGTSGGGVAGLLMAIRHPDTVRAVIADSCVEKWRPDEVGRMVEGRNTFSLGQAAFWLKAHGADWAEVVRADTEMILRVGANGFDFYDGRLREIGCPVLLTDSLGDEMLPRVGEQVANMARQIPDCRTFIVDEARHPMMWSRPEGFRKACSSFLEGLGL